MKITITKEVYAKPVDQLTEAEQDFLLGAWSLGDLDNFAKICENARNIYANVESVSKSGLSRKISFYCIGIDGREPYIKRLNRFIRCFNLAKGKTKEDFLHSMNTEKKKFLDREHRLRYYELDEAIKTSVCGMDPIFAELHSIFRTLKSLGYENISDDASSYRIL